MEYLEESKLIKEIKSKKIEAVVVCGLPGTGKSTIARKIRAVLEAVHLDTDRLRKKWRYIPDYSFRESSKNYERLKEKGEELLKKGRKVVFDGTFLLREGRFEFYDLFEKLGINFSVVYVSAPESVIERRLQSRKYSLQDPDSYSDADWQVYSHLKDKLEKGEFSSPLDDAGIEAFSYLSKGVRVRPVSLTQVLDGVQLVIFSIDRCDRFEDSFRKILEYFEQIPNCPKVCVISKGEFSNEEAERIISLNGRSKKTVIREEVRNMKTPSNKCLLFADNEEALRTAEDFKMSRIWLPTFSLTAWAS